MLFNKAEKRDFNPSGIKICDGSGRFFMCPPRKGIGSWEKRMKIEPGSSRRRNFIRQTGHLRQVSVPDTAFLPKYRPSGTG
jgi:hypothetical protein